MSADFSAAASALGYLFQFRYALLLLLERGEDAELRLECLDDIVIEDSAGTSLHQLKLHQNGIGDLSDLSVDLWKTLRVWSTLAASGQIILPGTALLLVTTASAPQHSAASLLKLPNQRDSSKALSLLVAACAKSKNKQLESAFNAFTGLTSAQRQLLVDAIVVLDGSPDVTDVGERIKKHLALSTYPEHLQALVERLEGWWDSALLSHLRATPRAPISHSSLQLKVLDIADQFRADSLPIDYASAHPGVIDAAQDPRLFVKQLHAIEANPKRVENAILDYYRAAEQRSRWVREDLILDEELTRYEDRLVEEWDRVRLAFLDDIPKADPSEAALLECGKKLYRWVELTISLPIRPRVTTAYVMRGSFHMLADRTPPRVWWHPKFLETVKKILVGTAEKADATVS